jgi:hypothetical protein
LPGNTCPAIIEVGSHDYGLFSPAIFEAKRGTDHELCLLLLAALLLELGKTSLLRQLGNLYSLLDRKDPSKVGALYGKAFTGAGT